MPADAGEVTDLSRAPGPPLSFRAVRRELLTADDHLGDIVAFSGKRL
jgi:hypothetical protein